MALTPPRLLLLTVGILSCLLLACDGAGFTATEGFACSSDGDCSVEATGLTCKHGRQPVCECHPFKADLSKEQPTKPVFSKEEGRCVVQVGEPCVNHKLMDGGYIKCKGDSTCEPNEDHPVIGVCTANSENSTPMTRQAQSVLTISAAACLLLLRLRSAISL